MMRMIIGVFAGFIGGALIAVARDPPAPQSDCSVAEVGAERCDRALLTCLSVQVRVIRELETLQGVCTHKEGI